MLCLVTNTSCEQMPTRDIKNVITETRGQSFQKFKVDTHSYHGESNINKTSQTK